MPTVTSMLSRNCCERAGIDSTPASGPARSPAKKFRPTRRTPASPTALTNASTAASPGTGSSNGHQNSTAPKPADRAAAGRRRRGSSVNSMEQFARYGSEWLMIHSTVLSIDGSQLSLCEYGRPATGPPSTGTAAALLLRRFRGRPSHYADTCPSHFTDLRHDHARFVPVPVTKIRDMSAAGGLRLGSP